MWREDEDITDEVRLGLIHLAWFVELNVCVLQFVKLAILETRYHVIAELFLQELERTLWIQGG